MAKMAKHLFVVSNDNYDMETLISIRCSTEDVVAWLEKNTNEEISEDFVEAIECKGVARTVVHENLSVICFSEWEETPYHLGILAHEVFHLTEMTFSKIGIPHCVDHSSEAYAYFIGSMYKKIYEGISLCQKPKSK